MHQVEESIEEICRIVWTGSGLWVVLNAKSWPIQQFEPFHYIVVEVDVRNSAASINSIEDPISGRLYRKAMIVSCDFNLPGGFIEDWLIYASMSEAQFVSLKS